MQHLDDGVIHALLDGELTGSESDAVRDHVQLCPVCADRLAEERLVQSEAERMIAELDTPDAPPAPAMPPRTEEFPGISMAPDQPRSSGPPVVLMPERDFQRSRVPRIFGWAATLLVAAGAGYFASVARQGPPAGINAGSLPELEPQAAAPAPEADPAIDLGADSGKTAQRLATPSFDGTLSGGSSAELGAGDAGVAAGRVAKSVADTEIAAPAAEMDSAPLIVEESENEREPPVVVPPPAAVARDRAAERQESLARAEERADAAAAAARVEVPLRAETPAETPRTALERTAQIRMRIGLDETSRMLGSPLHVIDGLQPQLVGLVDGSLVQGADPNAPVVRVVYLDEARRAIYLDQQRVALARRQMGAARDTIPPDWVKGDVWLSLKGDLSADELSALARRVR